MSGEGDVFEGDPMIYEGGDKPGCSSAATTEAYWYCWYDVASDVVSLDYM